MSDVAVAAEVIPASRTVLTSENAQGFYAQKLGLVEPAPVEDPKPDADKAPKPGDKAEPAVESPEEQIDEPGAQEAEAQQTESDTEKKQRRNQRFSELTQRAKDAEAKADAERAARELAEQQAAELRAKYEPPKSDELGPKPTRSQFNTEGDYEQALEDYLGDKATREANAKVAHERITSAFVDRAKAFQAETPDYADALNASTVAVGPEMTQAILESEAGPQILYHLAKHPEEAARLKSMGVQAMQRALGRLEGKLLDAKAPADPAGKKPAAAAAEVSRAPAPISPLKGSGTAVASVPIDSKGEFYGTAAEYRRLRKEGKIK